jgi:diacylglycerol kinase (ATP)
MASSFKPQSNTAPHMNDQPTVSPKRQGLSRVWHAFFYSIEGLRAGWGEPAFRQEAILAVLVLPGAWYLGQSWAETVLLIGVVVAVLVVELLNTGIEAAIDRVGPEWHAQSKRAKDTASAAVLLSLLLCGGVWLSALWRWFFA